MNDFDKYLRDKASQEKTEIPESVKTEIEKALASLPEKNSRRHHTGLFPRFAIAVACSLFIALFLLPNISSVYAKALEKIPVIGEIVQVITIRNYFYSDDSHEMNVAVPKVELPDNGAANAINDDIDQLTKRLTDQFYKDLKKTGDSGHSSIETDYEVVTNTKQWFTLMFSVTETMASSNTQYQYYHIDKSSGKIVKLSDLFRTEDFSEIIAENIRKQMIEQMKNDTSLIYWINDSEIGEDFSSVKDNQNFYWNKNGNLVIIFDEYEVGPGYMGTPSFVIKKNVIKNILKPAYLHLDF